MINTVATQVMMPPYSAYAASKGALETCTKMLASELGEHGIRVNGIHFGWIYTQGMLRFLDERAAEQDVSAEDLLEGVVSSTALRYIPPPSELVGTVLYLASDLSRPVTGQALHVNAGEFFH
jgi:NAD(P)-dependent dehydrogenase (short-subunit alcohol dehydrogenase family)